jgi:EAL domain-containing protein (putative c-di-GMP-specific phosphodiesterase class I)
VDDFGTGYSSLSYLRQFPVDVLKIDQSFLQELTADPDGMAIVTAIIDMGRSLRHVGIAEGIETQAQKENLQARRCAEGQGYLFSRPVAAKQFAQLLKTGVTEKLLN